MKKLLTLILVLCSVVGFAQMRGGAQYDPGAMRTGNIALAATGTAALPAYSFSSDPDTGIYSPAADSIGFSKGGAESMRITSGGNVLIATSTDDGANKLQVNGKVSFVEQEKLSNGASNMRKYISPYLILTPDEVYDTGIADAENASTINFVVIDWNIPRRSTFDWDFSTFVGIGAWLTGTKDHASTVNIYIEGGTWKIQNKFATKAYIVVYMSLLQ